MASKSASASGFAPVLSALTTMQSNVAGKEKTEAHEFLEQFQKSVGVGRNSPRTRTYRLLVRSMEYHTCNPTGFIDTCRGQTLCCYNPEGQGNR